MIFASLSLDVPGGDDLSKVYIVDNAENIFKEEALPNHADFPANASRVERTSLTPQFSPA